MKNKNVNPYLFKSKSSKRKLFRKHLIDVLRLHSLQRSFAITVVSIRMLKKLKSKLYQASAVL